MTDLFFYSYFLFSISHPDKHGNPCFDLSKDTKAEVSQGAAGFSQVQLSLERVVVRTLREYDVAIEIDKTIRNAFKCKLRRMGQRL